MIKKEKFLSFVFLFFVNLSVFSEDSGYENHAYKARSNEQGKQENQTTKNSRDIRFEMMFWPGAGFFQRAQKVGDAKMSSVVFTPPLEFYFSFPIGDSFAILAGAEWLMARQVMFHEYVLNTNTGTLSAGLNSVTLMVGMSFDFDFGKFDWNIGPSWVTWHDHSFQALGTKEKISLDAERSDYLGLVTSLSYRHKLFPLWNTMGLYAGPSVGVMWSNGWGAYGGINIGIASI